MSYIEYMRMLGLEVSKAEANPHVDFSWDDSFSVYGTLWLDAEGKPLLAKLYVWSAGEHDLWAELERRLGEMGHPGKVVHTDHHGNGHFTAAFGTV